MRPAIMQTMAWAYQQICAGEDPWTALGNFTNAWYGYARDMRSALVSEPLAEPEQGTDHTLRWGAFCAASVAFLCDRYAVPCPQWVHLSCYTSSLPGGTPVIHKVHLYESACCVIRRNHLHDATSCAAIGSTRTNMR